MTFQHRVAFAYLCGFFLSVCSFALHALVFS